MHACVCVRVCMRVCVRVCSIIFPKQVTNFIGELTGNLSGEEVKRYSRLNGEHGSHLVCFIFISISFTATSKERFGAGEYGRTIVC